MRVSVSAAGGRLYSSSEVVPESLKSNLLPTASAVAIHDQFGYVLFQHIEGNGFQIWHNQYNLNEPITCTTVFEEPVLELHIVYKNSIPFELEAFGSAVMREGRFNFSHMPLIRNNSKFQPGDYRSFDIHYTKEFLLRFTQYMPKLEGFLSLVEKNKPALLSKVSPPLTPAMRSAIQDILAWDHRDALTEFYLETKVFELLLHAITVYNKSSLEQFKLDKNDIETLYEAKKLLQSDSNHALSLSSLAKKLGTNEFKLKKGFRWLHGTSVFGYLQQQRMERAKNMLLSTSKQLMEIALEIGYQDLSSFSRAFNNHFGYSPNSLRKSKHNLNRMP